MSDGAQSFTEKMQALVRERRDELKKEEEQAEAEATRVYLKIQELQNNCSHPNAVSREAYGFLVIRCPDCGFGELYIDTMPGPLGSVRHRKRRKKKSDSK